MKKITFLWRILIQLLFPLRCPACDKIVRLFGEKICPECINKFSLLTQPWCMKCGKKLYQQGEYCSDCKRIQHHFIRGRAIYEYQSAAPAIYRLKYAQRQEYADFFGEEISVYLTDFIKKTKAEALIPIPMYPAKQRKRGYNQAELLANAISKYTGIPVYSRLLVRIKNTKPLKQLNPSERQNNLKKAFNIIENDVKLKSVIIVDDIYTTGSTIDEAAMVLKQHGVEKIYFITLACGSGL